MDFAHFPMHSEVGYSIVSYLISSLWCLWPIISH